MSQESALKALLAPGAAEDSAAQSKEEGDIITPSDDSTPTAPNSDGHTAPMAAELKFLEGYLQSLKF